MLPSLKGSIRSVCCVVGYLVVAVATTVGLIEFACWGGWSAYQRIKGKPELNARASPVYEGQPWAPEYLKEEALRHQVHTSYVAFRVWGVVNFQGKLLNNDQTEMGLLRRTINPIRPSCTPETTTNIWMFGGSALYGTGVPDWATLPSYLSAELNAKDSTCVVVTNFGVEGYVTNQELIVLMEQLQAGRHPQMVIFYDGVNDSGAAAYSSTGTVPHFLFAEVKRRVEDSTASKFDFLRQSHSAQVAATVLRALGWRRSTATSLDVLARKAKIVLDNYEANLRLAKTLGKAYGFTVYAFWQPSLYYGKKPMVKFEKDVVENPELDVWAPEVRAGYAEARDRVLRSSDSIFLGDLLDSAADPLYIDMVHLGPEGNQIAAKAIADYIGKLPASGH